MSNPSFRIEGPRSEIAKLKAALERTSEHVLKLSPVAEAAPSALSRRPAGMDPVMYFTCAFTAHLAASMAHDGLASLKQWLAKRADESKARVKIQAPAQTGDQEQRRE